MLFIWTIVYILMISPYASEAASLVCYKGSITNFKELSLKESPQFVNTEYLPKGCKLTIVCHGYGDSISKNILSIVSSLIKKYGADRCYCALNWKKEAAAYIGPITKPIANGLGVDTIWIDYPAVSAIALLVAKHLSNALRGMQSRGFNIYDLYLIGHSEGSHLSGNVGKMMKESGITIKRITGLDPVKPAIEPILQKGDAELVDCVHTSFGLFGNNESADCDINFWVNYGCEVQPGCKKNAAPLTLPAFCSHDRSITYMAEAILNSSYQGRKAATYEEFTQSSGTPDPDNVNIIGSDIKPSVTGNFYLCTNAEPEYGRGPAGMNPSSCTCPTT